MVGGVDAFRIGVGAGFAGDRIDPADALARDGGLNAMAFECLAERTIALAQLARLTGASQGYDPRLRRRLAGTLPHLLPNRAVVTTNAGAANPQAAARDVRALIHELGLPPVPVAAVTGDDVLDVLDRGNAQLWEDGRTVADLGDRVISANAYIGAQPLLDALEEGARVVIAGRCSDAALFLAPIMHHQGWSLEDLDRTAEATLVGHLLECAGQLTGGYAAEPGRFDVAGLSRLGFPFADVAADGSAVYGKLPGSGGRLDCTTVLEQLLYEIDDPGRYLTPDVGIDFRAVTIDDLGGDRVRVAGAVPVGRPEQLKVSVGVRDGRLAVAEIAYAGTGCLARGRLAEQIVRERWQEVHGLDGAQLEISYVGWNSTRPWWEPEGADPLEIRVRFALRTPEPQHAVMLCEEVEGLYTNGPAGGGGVVTSVTETVGIVSTFIDRDLVDARAEVLA
ncbi:acyclic terpene utilization AtuA family protein [Gryllotalpicola koreensis]|uniref:DUF1446 domain-containing protein n=1 Tax=Gryllotalpicola koreensis TaxID=993086 RepID=A0ABP7ZQQ4_9MICO